MTVKELRDDLAKYPDDMKVATLNYEGIYYEASEVTQEPDPREGYAHTTDYDLMRAGYKEGEKILVL